MSNPTARLDAAVAAVCPITGVAVDYTTNPPTATVRFDPAATDPQKAAAQSVVNAFDWSGAAQTAFDNTQARAQADALLSDPSATMKVLRGVLLLILSEINLLRKRDVDRAADVAAATTLADLKTRWAAESALSPRTAVQLRAAVQGLIDDGTADS